MLQGLFNYDNPVWRFIGKLGDLILLNILWIVCSIPIVTAGAATTAVYYVTLKLVRDENDGTIKNCFHSFKENFVQSTIIWVILLAAGALLAFDFWFFLTGQMNSLTGVPKLLMTAVFGGFLMLYIFISTYVFALQSRFYNPVKRTLFNAFFMVAMLLILFGFPLIAFINSYFFTAIFQKYMPKKEEHKETDMVPLMDDDNKEVEEAINNLKGN